MCTSTWQWLWCRRRPASVYLSFSTWRWSLTFAPRKKTQWRRCWGVYHWFRSGSKVTIQWVELTKLSPGLHMTYTLTLTHCNTHTHTHTCVSAGWHIATFGNVRKSCWEQLSGEDFTRYTSVQEWAGGCGLHLQAVLEPCIQQADWQPQDQSPGTYPQHRRPYMVVVHTHHRSIFRLIGHVCTARLQLQTAVQCLSWWPVQRTSSTSEWLNLNYNPVLHDNFPTAVPCFHLWPASRSTH